MTNSELFLTSIRYLKDNDLMNLVRLEYNNYKLKHGKQIPFKKCIYDSVEDIVKSGRRTLSFLNEGKKGWWFSSSICGEEFWLDEMHKMNSYLTKIFEKNAHGTHR